MKYKVEKKEGYTLVTVLTERLSGKTALDLKSGLVLVVNEGEKNIILDLKESKSCGHYGMNAMIIGNRLCSSSGGTFVVVNVNDEIEETITMAQMDTALNIAPTMEEACKLLDI